MLEWVRHCKSESPGVSRSVRCAPFHFSFCLQHTPGSMSLAYVCLLNQTHILLCYLVSKASLWWPFHHAFDGISMSFSDIQICMIDSLSSLCTWHLWFGNAWCCAAVVGSSAYSLRHLCFIWAHNFWCGAILFLIIITIVNNMLIISSGYCHHCSYCGFDDYYCNYCGKFPFKQNCFGFSCSRNLLSLWAIYNIVALRIVPW